MSIKALATDTAKLAPPSIVMLFWQHVPEIIQVCMLIYAVGLAVQTCYRFSRWLCSRFAARSKAS